MNHQIITINRQFGSGGREVAKRLADELQYAYYDKELIAMISEKTNLHPDYIEQFQESAMTRQYSLNFGITLSMPQSDINCQIQLAQTQIIRELGAKQNCIFVGRCANDIFGERAFKVFIQCSNINTRIQRCYDKVPTDKSKSVEQIRSEILSVDKQRAKYIACYTGQDWFNLSNYNLCIDTAKMDIKKAVQLIVKAVEPQ